MACEETRLVLCGGSADDAETRAASMHARQCASCREWMEADARLGSLLAALPFEELGSDFRGAVMERVLASAPPRAAWWRSPALVVHGLCAVAAGCFLASPYGAAMASHAASSLAALASTSGLEVPSPIDAIDALSDIASNSGVLVVGAIALAGHALLLRRPSRGGSTLCLLILAVVLVTLEGTVTAQGAEPQSDIPRDVYESFRQTSDLVRVLALSLVSLLAGIGVGAAAVVVRARFDRVASAADRVLDARSGAYQFFIGLFDTVVVVAAAIALAQLGAPLGLLALVLLCMLVVVAIVGFAARARVVGQDVLGIAGRKSTELAETAAGAATLALVLLIPGVGHAIWLVLLVFCVGTGLHGIMLRRKER